MVFDFNCDDNSYASHIQMFNIYGIGLAYPLSNRKEKGVKAKHRLPEAGIIMVLINNQAFLRGDGFEDDERVVY